MDEEMGEEDLEAEIAKEMEDQAGEGEDFFYSANEYAQVRTESLVPMVVSEEVCMWVIQLQKNLICVSC